jgi:hypothetical protein
LLTRKEVQRTDQNRSAAHSVGVLALCGVVGVVADAAAVVLLFWAPWAPIFTKGGWDLAGTITVISLVVGIVIYFVLERARTQVRGATPQVERGLA